MIQYQKRDFSQNFSVPFHRVTFGYSISCVLLIDEPNESCQNSEKFERNVICKTKKSFPILQTSSKRLKLTIQTYQMRNSEA